MIIKRIEISEIVDFLKDHLVAIKGDITGAYIDNLSDVAHVCETTLDWISPQKENKQQIAENSKAFTLLVDESIQPIEGKLLLVVDNPKVCLALIGNYFFMPHHEIGIHPTAIISPNAKIGENVSIGPYAVVGAATIGDDCIIDSFVRITDFVKIGNRCIVKSGAVLGGEGFGFEKDEEGNRFRFPQIGNLVIGDDVEIGANTCIDRGALSDTIIGHHTKINNLCHIAHNNEIGNNVEITGCVNVSGGNVIDDNVWIAPNSSLKGYLHIGENAFIGMGAVVTKNVPANEVWVGNPAKKLR